MKRCKECGELMRRTYRFNPDGSMERYYRCRHCHWDSRPTRSNMRDMNRDEEFWHGNNRINNVDRDPGKR